jgi:inorganic pyrophosphatase/exopolyphosphatase
LENNLSKNIFINEKIDLISIISSIAATTFENSFNYTKYFIEQENKIKENLNFKIILENYVFNVFHEIRNTLNGINGFVIMVESLNKIKQNFKNEENLKVENLLKELETNCKYQKKCLENVSLYYIISFQIN